MRGILLSLLLSVVLAYVRDDVKRPDRPKPTQGTFEKPIFVFEMIRHAARSTNEDNVDAMEFFGVEKGMITLQGRREAYKIG